MRTLRTLAGLGLLAAAGAANAELSATITAVSDYDYRGVTQTDEDPALQASVDWEDDSGWYVGAWASNVDFPGYDGSIELDLYTGFAGETEGGLGWDVGIVYYAYPDSDGSDTEAELLEFPEIYGGVSYGPFEGKLWYSNDFGGTDESSAYLEGNLAFPLPQNLTLLLHAGYSDGDAIDVLYGDSYLDYSAGVGYTLGNFELALKYVGNDIDGEDYDDRVIFSVATTFPWGE